MAPLISIAVLPILPFLQNITHYFLAKKQVILLFATGCVNKPPTFATLQQSAHHQ
jgi:hypothetical protein